MYAIIARVAVGAKLDCQSVQFRALPECALVDVVRLQILAISVADIAFVRLLLYDRHYPHASHILAISAGVSV